VSAFITIEDVRNFIWDRSSEDNQIELDLAFSDDEIRDAMRRAAREYNSVPPYVSHADPAKLEADTNIFLDAIAMQLYISRISRMQRNDIDYTAGGMQVELEKKQIGYMKEMIPFHKERFLDAAKAQKVFRNLRRAFGRVG
jgi:hypothetical protein